MRMRMQSSVVLALICLSAASADISCDECMGFAGNMQQFYLDQATLADQTNLIVAKICPEDDDPKACEVLARGTWHYVGAALYKQYFAPSYVCGKLELCDVVKSKISAMMAGTPSCDECTNSLDRVAKGIATEEAIQEAISFLKGSGFCDITSDAETCAYMMDQYIPKVLPILSGDMQTMSKQNCCIFSENNVCC